MTCDQDKSIVRVVLLYVCASPGNTANKSVNCNCVMSNSVDSFIQSLSGNLKDSMNNNQYENQSVRIIAFKNSIESFLRNLTSM